MPNGHTARAPGAYLEQAFRPRPPEFRTGVPAFVGLVRATEPRGSAAEGAFFASGAVARLDARSFAELETRAAASWGGGALGLAVRGFFQNGGSLCYIVDPRLGGVEQALDALSGVDDFDLVCAPDLAWLSVSDLMAAQVTLARFCRDRGGCFAILDSIGSPTLSLDIHLGSLGGHRDELEAALTLEQAGHNAAVYGPWIKVRGGCAACAGAGIIAGDACVTCAGTGMGFVPPSGHVAGVYARTDGRSGVHKAPANEAMEGVVDVQLSIDEAGQGYLNPEGKGWVNCLRAFPGRGVRVWGARTLSTEDSSSQVNVRRLLLTIGRWLERSAQDLAFEPNNFALWVRINRQAEAYLQGLFAAGALRGRSAKDAYFVKCDAENNPPEVQQAGKVVAEVGVAPVRPNEFIIVRLVTGAEGASASVAR